MSPRSSSSRSCAAFGIVTNTTSGASRSIARSIPAVVATTLTPFRRRPQQTRCVVDEADDALAGRLPQLAQQAASGPSGADDQDAAAGAAASEVERSGRSPVRRTAAAAIAAAADECVDHEDAAREVADRSLRERDDADRRDLRDDDRSACTKRVARARVPPDARVHAEEQQRDVAAEQEDRQREQEVVALVRRADAVEAKQVRGQERRRDQCAVDERPRRACGCRRQSFGVRARGSRSTSARKAAELHEQREGDEHADRGDPAVAERLVGEAGRAERRRDQRQQHDGSRLGDAERDEPVRAVVAPALRDGPSVEQPHDRHERRVEDRHGEHEHRQHERRDRRRSRRCSSTRARATRAVNPISCEPLSPIQASARLPGRRLNGRKPRSAGAERHRRSRARAAARLAARQPRGEEAGRDHREARPRGRPCCRAG